MKYKNNKKYKIIFIIIFVLILIHFFFLNNNYEALWYVIKQFFKGNNNSGIPTSSYINKIILNQLEKINNISEYTFIDFGCGDGHVLINVHPLFNKVKGHVIGVDLDKDYIDTAIDNVNNHMNILYKENILKDKFLISSDKTNKKYKRENISLHLEDIINTKYKNEDTIFYLYEPLWNVGTKEESRGIYSKVFNNLKNTFSTNGKNLYIVYISGISRKDIDVEYLKQYGFTTEIFNKQIGSLFLYRNILIYKFHM